MTGALTVLRAHEERRLAKAFELATIGDVRLRSYDKATWFSAESVALAGIRDLHRLLLPLEGDPGACVIRGEAAEGGDLLRTKRNKGAFPETPRPWVMLDADGIPLPAGCSVLADPEDAARVLLDLLAAHAPELEGATAIVQFSASAGLDEVAEGETLAGIKRPGRWRGVVKPGLSAHVWYWLRRPLGEAELIRWRDAVAAAGLTLDAATLRTVQPHYTAAPSFGAGLRDPLAGRRTLLIEGTAEEVELRIPAPAPKASRIAQDGAGAASAGRGYEAYLGEIGGPDGFRAAMLRAVASFVGSNWPEINAAALKADLRAQIEAADPGGRPVAVLTEYASDRHLDSLIAWAMAQEEAKRAAAKAEAARPIEPAFPDRGVTLATAERQATQWAEAVATQLRRGETLEMMLRITVGGGKSQAAIAAAGELLDAAHEGGRIGALFYLVPRHDLGGEILERIAAAHPGRTVAIWRGMDQPDPLAPGRKMCLDRELTKLATAAGLKATEVCGACPLRDACGYRRQRGQDADIWILAHNFAFQSLPSALPPAAVMVIDEAFWQAGLKGTNALEPVEMAVSALAEERTGRLTGLSRQRLLELRRLVAVALAEMDQGGIARAPFDALGFTAASAAEWQELEWQTKPAVALSGELGRDGIAERLREAASNGFTPRRPMLAKHIRALLEGPDARSGGAELLCGVDLGRERGSGDVIRFAWRQDFAKWAAGAPKLFLDATTHPDVTRQWAPGLTVADIEIAAPAQHVRQVIGGEFGRTFFTKYPNNVRRLADLLTVELASSSGPVLAIAQAAVEEALEAELRRRFDGELPARLLLAHHGAITGLDCFREVERIVIVGRPALNREAGERLAEVLKGSAVAVVAEEGSRWPKAPAGIRLADGTGAAVRQPYHPDPLVEALRWSLTEGAVLQAIGRARGVRRAVHVTLLAELALPLTVAAVETWDEAQADRLELAAAEAALAGRALPLAPGELAKLRPDLWPSANAAELDLKRRKGGSNPYNRYS